MDPGWEKRQYPDCTHLLDMGIGERQTRCTWNAVAIRVRRGSSPLTLTTSHDKLPSQYRCMLRRGL